MKPDFEEIRLQANGMLAPEVYANIYESALLIGDGDIVEVGTAHGAATICLALAMKQLKTDNKVLTFEKVVGGSREQYGDIDTNVSIIERNFEHFGVSNLITLIIDDVETAGEQINRQTSAKNLSLLMLDADGAIDRDLNIFYNRLSPGAPIIIDDCNDYLKVKILNTRYIKVDLKHKITHYLVDYFVNEGILEKVKVVNNTFFGRKPAQITGPVDFLQMGITNQYRKLVFTEGPLPNQYEIIERKQSLPRKILRYTVRRVRKYLKRFGSIVAT